MGLVFELIQTDISTQGLQAAVGALRMHQRHDAVVHPVHEMDGAGEAVVALWGAGESGAVGNRDGRRGQGGASEFQRQQAALPLSDQQGAIVIQPMCLLQLLDSSGQHIARLSHALQPVGLAAGAHGPVIKPVAALLESAQPLHDDAGGPWKLQLPGDRHCGKALG